MRIIGIKLNDGDKTVIKNLKVNTWYPFGDYQEPTEDNGWQWLASDMKEQENLCSQMYKSVTDSDVFASTMQITVNCIVGRNGSGKSTLLELLFRIINNFAFKIIDKSWEGATPDKNPQMGHLLTEAAGFSATLFFETDCNIGVIKYNYGNVNYYGLEAGSSRILEKKLGEKITTNYLKEIFSPFFYTVYTNYSIYSLNEDDYQSSSLWNDGTEGVDGKWLRGLLHKNDGYLTPLVMIPYREEGGGIDVQNEKALAKQRLATLAMLFKSQQKSFMGEYEIQELVYCFNDKSDECYLEKFESLMKDHLPLNDEKDVYEKLKDAWREYLKDDAFRFIERSLKVQNSILNYLIYKTLKVCLQYRNFGEMMGIRNPDNQEQKKLNNKKNVWIAELPAEYANTIVDVIDKEKVDIIDKEKKPSHITLKIHQMLEFLKRGFYKTPDEDHYNVDSVAKKLVSLQKIKDVKNLIALNLEFDNRLSEEKKRKRYDTYDEVFLWMPPAIFEWDVAFKRLNGNKHEEYTTLSQMSSGEKQLLQSFSYVLYHIKNIQSVKAGKFFIPFHHITLIFDEAELYYHPEYQRQFISQLMRMLSWCHIDGRRIRGINIIVVTHSPFVLSDVPAVHTLYLKDGEVIRRDNQTFGANIHELLANQFFVKDTMGEVSRGSIERVAELYKRMISDKEKGATLDAFCKEKDVLEYAMSIIGEPYIRRVTQGMLKELKKAANIPLETKRELENERELLRKRLLEIDNLIDNNN